MKVSIIGATGYAGEELLRLLHHHPQVEIVHITSESYTGKNISEVYPHLNGIYDQELESMKDIDAIADDSDFIFSALPAGLSMRIGLAIEDKKTRLIDLGADYRFFDPKVYEEWYGLPHLHKNAARVYGLAEIYRDEIRTAKIIANAGCYTTASILALAPLVKHHLVESDSIIIDAKSGVSGAGRSLTLGNHFAEMFENFKAYKVATHRHTPEIEQALSDLSGERITLNFSPHLVPMSRGIFATCYANLKPDITKETVNAAFAKMYGNEKFIRVLGRGGYPEVKNVRGSNYCDIAWHRDQRTNRIIVLSVIDNLVKGAAGQAVQNFNIACGFDEDTGLDIIPLYP